MDFLKMEIEKIIINKEYGHVVLFSLSFAIVWFLMKRYLQMFQETFWLCHETYVDVVTRMNRLSTPPPPPPPPPPSVRSSGTSYTVRSSLASFTTSTRSPTPSSSLLTETYYEFECENTPSSS